MEGYAGREVTIGFEIEEAKRVGGKKIAHQDRKPVAGLGSQRMHKPKREEEALATLREKVGVSARRQGLHTGDKRGRSAGDACFLVADHGEAGSTE